MQRHATLEHYGCRGYSKSISELTHEEVGRGNVIDVGYPRVGSDDIAGGEDNGCDAKALQENCRSQDDGGGRGCPYINNRDIRRDQEHQSEDKRADSPQAGSQHVQSELETQSESKRIHGNETTRLQGAVILHEAEVLRDDIESGTEEGARDQNHQEVRAQGGLPPDHAQMKHRRRVLGTIVPP